ncbi:MAG TPA: CARDB domain-containing protein, partial [Candidatus Thermoplasmatota archaeon]|nr:CARDB domain-containing protein [Candidatus Thermoplasmatota archaeon]
GVVTVRLLLLQWNDLAGAYESPKGIETPGAARAVWTLLVKDETRLVPVPPSDDSTMLMPVTPAAPRANATLTIRAAVRNEGTRALQDLQATWRFEEVLRRGIPGRPGRSEDTVGWRAPDQAVPLGALPLGHQAGTNATFRPPSPGLYRASVTYTQAGALVNQSRFEFLVDLPSRYYGVQFANATQAADWVDRSPAPSPTRGGSPPSLRFRVEGEGLVWGVSRDDLVAGHTYCTRGVCNPETHANLEPWSYTGLEGIALQANLSALVDLGRVPQGKAVLTLEHHPRFTEGDGARVEALPLLLPAEPGRAPAAAFVCNGQPLWFVLEPEGSFGAYAQSRTGWQQQRVVPPSQTIQESAPHQLHPLDPDGLGPESLGLLEGSSTPVVSRFRLDQSATATTLCNGERRDEDLSSYGLQLRLHTGTLPGYRSARFTSNLREGDQDWQVRSMDVSSVAVEVFPAARTLPLSPTIQKQFSLVLRNAGDVPDTFRLSLLGNASFLPLGAEFRFAGGSESVLVPLDPGASRSMNFTVLLPPGPTANYLALLEARSLTVPTIVQQAQAVLALTDRLLPDLAAVAVEVQAQDGCSSVQLGVGKVCTLEATAFNLGRLASAPVKVRFSAVEEATQAVTIIDEATLPPLGCCGRGDKSVVTAQWLVPDAPGRHQLRVEVDPSGFLLESSLANNNATRSVQVVDLARPKLETELRILGLDALGLAEEGSFIELVANVTNVGVVPAPDVSLKFNYVGHKPAQAFGTMQPGERRTARLEVPAVPGSFLVEAIPECDRSLTAVACTIVPDQRMLHTRGHNLTVKTGPGAIEVAPGQTATTQLNVTSRGNSVDQVRFQLLGAPGWGLAVEPAPLTVAPGQTTMALATVRAPLDAPAGDTVLQVRAQPLGNAVVGTRFTLTVHVAAISGTPTLTVAGAATEPGPLALPVTVTSQSNSLLRGNLTVAGQPWLLQPFPFAVEPFANRTLSLPLAIPADTPPGEHGGVVQVRNATGSVLAQRLVRLAVLPLAAASAQWEGAILPGPADPGERTLRMSLLVRNEGNVPLVATASPGLLGQGLALRGASVPVPVRGAAVLPVEVRVAADAPDPSDGRAEVWIQQAQPKGADAALSGLAVHAASVPLPRLDAAPDLRVARVDRFPAGPVEAGRSVRIVAQVENRGPLAAPPSRLFAYANGDLLDDPLVPAIPPGESRQVNLTVTFERAGGFLLTLAADGAGGVQEIHEANNGVAQELEVQPPPPLSAPGLRRALPAPAATLLPLLAAVLLAAASRRRREGGA